LTAADKIYSERKDFLKRQTMLWFNSMEFAVAVISITTRPHRPVMFKTLNLFWASTKIADKIFVSALT
jgi:hypothetical protein